MCENEHGAAAITAAELDELRARLPFILSEKRARHVLGGGETRCAFHAGGG